MTELLAGYAVTSAVAFVLVFKWIVSAVTAHINSGESDELPPDMLNDAPSRRVLYACVSILSLLIASIWIHLLAALCLIRGALFILHHADRHDQHYAEWRK